MFVVNRCENWCRDRAREQRMKAPLRLDSAVLPPNTFAMTVDLARDVEDFVREQMAAGTGAEPAQLVNDVLRSVRDQQRQPFPVTPELEAWLLESADQPTTPLTDADFQAIRTRARDRRPATA